MIPSIACFITPHGYGHASRACAVLDALRRLIPDLHVHIYTRVPPWFFEKTLQVGFTYHDCLTDIGLIQKSALEEDWEATRTALDQFYPPDDSLLANLSAELRDQNCRLVLCDISPLGLAAAHRAGIPAVLEENFTWDWIYAAYPQSESYCTQLASLFSLADIHIQTIPVCAPSSTADFTVQPVARTPRQSRTQTRNWLGLADSTPAVLITMGGIGLDYPFIHLLKSRPDIHFIIPGASTTKVHEDNLLLLPHNNGFYHPDLVAAADAVVGKVGYSTLAEVYMLGLPFGYVPRSSFRESDRLCAFIEAEMPGLALDDATFHAGKWIDRMPDLLSIPRINRQTPNGADQIARRLADMLESENS